MKKVDLNVDIGEGFPHDEALLEFATSANICCGEHAGSWDLTTQTIDMCLRKGTRIGCHPGFPDRENFGRRIPPPQQWETYMSSVTEQIHRFDRVHLFSYIKPHGALYNILCSRKPEEDGFSQRAQNLLVGKLMIEWLFDRSNRAIMLLGGSKISKVYELARMPVISEGFADRRYRRDRTLVPRSEPNAVLARKSEITKQVLRLAPKVDSICLHGDTPNCLEFAELVDKTLIDAGYEVGY